MTNFQQIEPCPARGKFTESMFTDPNYFFEEKYDGDRRIGQFIDGTIRITGRTASKKDGLFVEKTDNLPHITKSANIDSIKVITDTTYTFNFKDALFSRAQALEGTILDGETLCNEDFIQKLLADWDDVGGLSKHTTSIMGSKPGEAVRKQQERGFMRWMVFDCLAYKGKDIKGLPYIERRKYAERAIKELGNPYVQLAKSVNTDKKAFLDAILARPDGEGIIAKHKDSVYGEQKKWAKNKRLANADVVVIGFEDPKEESEKTDGKVSKTKFFLNGWIGAAIIGQWRDGVLWRCGTISGMTEDVRIDMTKNPKKYLNQVVEIAHNGREPTGAFRHPRFKGVREDKTSKQCVYNPDEV